jgi:two-component system chemotaxis response regulator CheV
MSSSTISSILLDKDILLESGTNELEVLVFDVADYRFGINVAKVREVLPTPAITQLPKAHRSIRGVFKLRDQVIPCVSLQDHLGITPTRENAQSTMILADLNQQQTAFLVDQVERIHRLSWQSILAVPGLDALSHTPVTALARCDERLIVMLDFEMILDDVTDQYFRTESVPNPSGLDRETLRLLLAEDSPTIREAICTTLRASGYTQLKIFENGSQAWQWVEQRYASTGRVEDVGDLMIADVEMPQVDGFHLTRRMKEHPELKRIPVLLYSSIITPDNQKKGQAVGADAQVAKPELTEVVRLADELISAARGVAPRPVPNALPEVEPLATCPVAEPPRPAPSVPVAAPVETADARPAAEKPPAQSPSPAKMRADVPGGIAPNLWWTFHGELTNHCQHLRELLGRAEQGDHGEELTRDLLRTLHTIKAASMVLPLERVTQCTHLVESRMENARTSWPQNELGRYLEWLEILLSPPSTVEEALSQGQALEAVLGG